MSRMSISDKSAIAEALINQMTLYDARGNEGAIEPYARALLHLKLPPTIVAALTLEATRWAEDMTLPGYFLGDMNKVPEVDYWLARQVHNGREDAYVISVSTAIDQLTDRPGERSASNVIPFPVHRTRRPGVAA